MSFDLRFQKAVAGFQLTLSVCALILHFCARPICCGSGKLVNSSGLAHVTGDAGYLGFLALKADEILKDALGINRYHFGKLSFS